MEIILVPLINANEDEVEVLEFRFSEGDAIKQGDILAVVESTKAAMEIEAPCSGFVREVLVTEGQRIRVEMPMCAITTTKDEAVQLKSKTVDSSVRATKKARQLAEKYGFDLATLEIDGIIKERDVQAAVGKSSKPTFASHPREAIIYGAGGHAKVMIDILREGHRDIKIRGIVDDGTNTPDEVLGVPLIGDSSSLPNLREAGVRYAILGVGAVTNNKLRIELIKKLTDAGFEILNLIHPKAIVEGSTQMGSGNQIFGGAIVSSDVKLGDHTIINSGVIVSHDCTIGSYTHLTPGAILAGNVTIGENCVIGMGVTIYLGITIGNNVSISNGVHVMKDVADDSIVKG